jgi:hypothetical protein
VSFDRLECVLEYCNRAALRRIVAGVDVALCLEATNVIGDVCDYCVACCVLVCLCTLRSIRPALHCLAPFVFVDIVVLIAITTGSRPFTPVASRALVIPSVRVICRVVPAVMCE